MGGRIVQLSFDIEDKESDLSLTANIVMANSSEPESVTCDLLGFLYDGNCRLTVVSTHPFRSCTFIEVLCMGSKVFFKE